MLENNWNEIKKRLGRNLKCYETSVLKKLEFYHKSNMVLWQNPKADLAEIWRLWKIQEREGG